MMIVSLSIRQSGLLERLRFVSRPESIPSTNAPAVLINTKPPFSQILRWRSCDTDRHYVLVHQSAYQFLVYDIMTLLIMSRLDNDAME